MCFTDVMNSFPTQKKKKPSSLQRQPDSPTADLCTETGRRQADSIIVSFFSANSPTGMFKQLPTEMAAQQALLSSVDKQLLPEARRECEGPDEGITLAELHSALKALARGKKPGSDGLPYEFYTQFWDLLGPELLAVLQHSFQDQPASLQDPGGHHLAVQEQGRPILFGQLPPHHPPQ